MTADPKKEAYASFLFEEIRMKIQISSRLLLCAEMVQPGARVVDVGCDHGYLGIYLILSGKAAYVAAADLRPKPLENARVNAARFGVADRMYFSLCDGLESIEAGSVDTVVCAGMGGETIARILERCPWISDGRYSLILQPQTSGSDLRRWLGDHSFCIQNERLVRDGRFVYAVLRARFGGGTPVTPGQQYVSRALLESGDPLLRAYLLRVERALREAVRGMERAGGGEESPRLPYYRAALEEITQMRRSEDERSGRA